MRSDVGRDPPSGRFWVRLRCDCGAACDLRVGSLDEARATLRGAGWIINECLTILDCPRCAAKESPRR